jgi:hypothetical protein
MRSSRGTLRRVRLLGDESHATLLAWLKSNGLIPVRVSPCVSPSGHPSLDPVRCSHTFSVRNPPYCSNGQLNVPMSSSAHRRTNLPRVLVHQVQGISRELHASPTPPLDQVCIVWACRRPSAFPPQDLPIRGSIRTISQMRSEETLDVILYVLAVNDWRRKFQGPKLLDLHQPTFESRRVEPSRNGVALVDYQTTPHLSLAWHTSIAPEWLNAYVR